MFVSKFDFFDYFKLSMMMWILYVVVANQVVEKNYQIQAACGDIIKNGTIMKQVSLRVHTLIVDLCIPLVAISRNILRVVIDNLLHCQRNLR